MPVEWLTPDWPAPATVRALSTLRGGGVSIGRYASLNLGEHVRDSPEAVAENRHRLRVAAALPAEPSWLAQVHGVRIADLDVSPGNVEAAAPTADGAVTRVPGRICAILTADCLPVLLAACDGSAVAVAHAGWRGLAAGVLEATAAALAGHGPLQAWLGPAISSRHFEVGPEVREAFMAHESAAGAAFTANSRGRWQCDLPALARARLTAAGVRSVYADPGCTYDEPQRFYSYRRDGSTGRMAALIWLEAAQC